MTTPTTPPSMTPVPTPQPVRNDRSTFSPRVDAFVTWLPTFLTELAAVLTNAYNNSLSAYNSAAAALTSQTSASSSAASASLNASAAAGSAGAALWVSGTTYTVGYLVWSPANGRNYRRKVAGAGATDPSADATNWTPVTLDVSTGMPTIRPSLLLNFANSKQVDPRITFARASSATYFDRNGVLQLAAAGVPRIDFNPATGECLGLLLEESKTNLLTYSEQLDNAAWTPASNSATRTANNAEAPDGTTTADLVDDVSVDFGQLIRQVSVVADDSTSYTFSVFVKKSTSRYLALWLSFSGGTTRERVWTYDLDAITSQADITSPATSGTITDIGDGWRRITITHANTSEGNTSLGCRLYPAITALGAVDVTATGSVWAWGAQLETGLYASSYIPTTSVTVTRSADVATMTGVNFSNWYRQDEGSFVLRASIPGFVISGSSCDVISIGDGTTNNRTRIRVIGASGSADLYVSTGGVVQVDTADELIVGVNTQFIATAAYKMNDFALSVNGFAVKTDSSGTVPAVSQLSLCTAGSAWIAGFSFYPKRISNAELITLSTL